MQLHERISRSAEARRVVRRLQGEECARSTRHARDSDSRMCRDHVNVTRSAARAHAQRSPSRRAPAGSRPLSKLCASNACRTWCNVERYRARSSARRPSRRVALSLSSSSSSLSFSLPLPPLFALACVIAGPSDCRGIWRDGEIRPPLSVVHAGVGDRHARDALHSGCYHVWRREPFEPLNGPRRPASFTRGHHPFGRTQCAIQTLDRDGTRLMVMLRMIL